MKELKRGKLQSVTYLTPTDTKIVIREQVINYMKEHGE